MRQGALHSKKAVKSSMAAVKKTKVSCTGRLLSVQSIYSLSRVQSYNKTDAGSWVCDEYIEI